MRAYERLLEYVTYATQSAPDRECHPSTPGQFDLARRLVDDLKALGLTDAAMDEHAYVYAHLAATPGCEQAAPLGLIAHMDTSDEAPGDGVAPQLHPNYDGGTVALGASGLSLRAEQFPDLRKCQGETLITTDGTTLLGADDKAGVAEILTAAQNLIAQGGRHATLKIGFTPDEEIGRGADRFDVRGFGADYAYTADGGTVGEIEYENFNAAGAKVVFHGLNIHPGSAKDKMVNSMYIAMEFQSMLPQAQKPEYTQGYEGFIHLTHMEGEVEESRLEYILRDHDQEKLNSQKKVMEAAAAFLNAKYGMGTVELTIKDSYHNMKQCILPHMEIVERAKAAMEKAGMQPREVPIRGGTDGARLSYEGLLCPNLCTGGENFHGRFEFIPVEDMEQCVQMLEHLLRDF